MKTSAPLQDAVLAILLTQGVATLRQLTNQTPLNYYQVASVLVALCAKGYVERIGTGKYKITDLGAAIMKGPEAQVRFLKRRVHELETMIEKLKRRF